MTDEQSALVTEEDSQTCDGRSQEIFSPVIVTEGVGTAFLGIIAIILMVVVGSLLVRNRKLEDRLRDVGH